MSKPKYTTIDLLMTGQLIKRLITERGYSVAAIQEELGLSCPQPIYRWYKGQNIPSLDNLFILSRLLGLHMEDMLIERDDSIWIMQALENKHSKRRFLTYAKRIKAIA